MAVYPSAKVCPYCGKEFQINDARRYQLRKYTLGKTQCHNCNKEFLFHNITTSVSKIYNVPISYRCEDLETAIKDLESLPFYTGKITYPECFSTSGEYKLKYKKPKVPTYTEDELYKQKVSFKGSLEIYSSKILSEDEIIEITHEILESSTIQQSHCLEISNVDINDPQRITLNH